MSRWPRPLFYLVIVCALIADQVTKACATKYLPQPPVISSVVSEHGCLNLTYVRNRGIAFGMFAGQGLLVAIFAITIILVALYYTRGLNWFTWEPNVVGGALCGGALGNLIDRWRQGYVVDFIDFHLGPHHWPVFNVADSLICVAVGWIVVRQLFTPEEKKPNPTAY